MTRKTLSALILALAYLSGLAWAEEWKVALPVPFNVHTSDSFQLSRAAEKSQAVLSIADQQLNLRLQIFPAEFVPVSEMKKRFKTKASKLGFNILNGPETLSVGDYAAVSWQLDTTPQEPGPFLTTYVYVARPESPYSLLFNYPRELKAGQKETVSSILSSIR